MYKVAVYAPAERAEAESKEKHVVWDPVGVDYNLTFVDSRVDSNTCTMYLGFGL
jgi:hypothetical protein